MSDSLHVLMGDTVAGVLTRSSDGRLRFDYDEEYRRGGDPTSLSLSMPVQVTSHADQARSRRLRRRHQIA
ncbi:MAG TPA: HipA N-terminal domain-containing protein [Solirubrobacteraceae bacterium]|jgi:HipA-like protein|nr:HipA N-terminal domain-containing protein [Solirubrobacteraceae bacterium]